MADQLQDIVQRMVAAGESEDNIALVIKSYKPADAPKPPEAGGWGTTAKDVGIGVLKGAGSSLASLAELGANAGIVPGLNPAALAVTGQLRHPVFQQADKFTTASNGAQLVGKGIETAAELAMPARAVGRGALRLVRAAPSAVRTGAGMAYDAATGHPLRALMRVLGPALEKSAASTAPATAPSAATPVQAAGRLVKTPQPRPAPFAEAVTEALEKVRVPEPPKAITLPPPPELPPGYTPRASAPKPRAAAPNKATQASQPAPVETPAPAAPTSQLPSSWQALVDAAAGPKPAPAAAPTVNLPGIVTKRTPKPGAVETARSALGAREAGNLFGLSANDVRRIAPGPSRRPLKAQMADLDADYMRLIHDYKAALIGVLGGGGAAALAGGGSD